MFSSILAREAGALDSYELENWVRLKRVNGWRARKRYNTVKEPQCLAVDSSDGRFLLLGFRQEFSIIDATSNPRDVSMSQICQQHLSPRTCIVLDALWYPGDFALFLLGVSRQPGEGDVQIWDTDRLQCESRIATGEVSAMSMSMCSSSHELVAIGSAGFGNSIGLLDLNAGAVAQKLDGQNGPVKSLAFSPEDEHLLAAGGADGSVQLWDVRKAGRAACVQTFDSSKREAVIGDVVTGYGSKRRSWKRKRKPYRQPSAHADGAVSKLLFAPGGRYLLSVGVHAMYTWDILSGLCVSHSTFPVRNRHFALNAAVSMDQDLIYVSGGMDVGIFELFESLPTRYFERQHFASIALLESSPITEELYSVDREGELIGWTSNLEGS
ncbi:hypothetical protein NDN08_008066 [Rhodosorus marinus]|uniref:Anaphase-promoting complex subunit 4 WD40 domain-containing protein n=1 Tax=Rhodosorus marinus TaxID=101924 RepID=A0AAV8V255_9RHOD|nr:hypothetical protein NDN08_008066 [Rhodosorus marinus]